MMELLYLIDGSVKAYAALAPTEWLQVWALFIWTLPFQLLSAIAWYKYRKCRKQNADVTTVWLITLFIAGAVLLILNVCITAQWLDAIRAQASPIAYGIDQLLGR